MKNEPLEVSLVSISNGLPSDPAKKALFSQNVSLPGFASSVPCGILIENELIIKVLAFPEEVPSFSSLEREHSDYAWEDVSPLFINPGLIDLNVCFNSDSEGEHSGSMTSSTPERSENYELGTLAALASGVTTVIETPALHPSAMSSRTDFYRKIEVLQKTPLYTDLGFLANISPENVSTAIDISEVFGFKAYLVPPAKAIGYFSKESLPSLFERLELTGKPLFCHSELTNERFVYLNSPFRTEDIEERASMPEPVLSVYAGAFPEELTVFSAESSPAKDCSPSRPDSENFRELDKMYAQQQNNIESLVKVEIESYDMSGRTVFSPPLQTSSIANSRRAMRPPPIIIEKPAVAEEKTDYKTVLANSAPHWQVNAVQMLMTQLQLYPQLHLHICNLSAASAIIAFNKLRKEHPQLKATCETANFYLHFSEKNIRPGDTRFKVTPPIREESNREMLNKVFRLGIVDALTSYHRHVKPSFKYLQSGNFRRAMPGISSIGFNLQTSLESFNGDQTQAAAKIAKILSENPAKIVGLNLKGTIAEGKLADLIVWDPYTRQEIRNPHMSNPSISPFFGEVLTGKIVRTYLRGKLAYQDDFYLPAGQILYKY